MTDSDFFRNSAHECRELALRARTEAVRRELLFWAKEFEAMATERQPSVILTRQALEPAD